MLLAVTWKYLQIISCITTVFIAQKHFLEVCSGILQEKSS